MSLDMLKEDIKSNNYRRVYLFYGPESFLIRYYLGVMEKALIRSDFKQLNKVVIDGKIESRRVIDECEALPMFSDKKMVIVRNSSFFKPDKKNNEKGSKIKKTDDDFFTYLDKLPESVCLVFWENEIDKRLKQALTAINKNGIIVEFPFQKPNELVKWITKFVKSKGKEIDTTVASQLIENSEPGMQDVMNETIKLLLYLGDRIKVTVLDIDKVCTKSIKSRIFDLTDAIAEQNGMKALVLLDDMIMLKEPIPKIHYMVAKHLRQLLEMKQRLEGGETLNEAGTAMGVLPFIAGKLKKQAGSFLASALKSALYDSLELDVAVKTGRIEDKSAIMLLIAGLRNNK